MDHCTVDSGNFQGIQVYHLHGEEATSGMDHGLITRTGDRTSSCSLRIVLLVPVTGRAAIDCYEGARVVVRHSTFNNALISAHGTEGQGRGTKQLEIYNNVFTVSPRRNAGQIRSGSVVIHDNVYNNFTTGMT